MASDGPRGGVPGRRRHRARRRPDGRVLPRRSATWIAGVASDLARGVLLLIDYGAPAAELYDPVRRRDGTLRAYVRHQVHDDPYRHVGRQDLTAHVDVTAVERAAHAAGLTTIGITTQAEALMGLGIEARLQAIQADPATTFEEYTLVRSALMRLLDPAAMGRFRVMAFGRDWPVAAAEPPLGLFAFRIPSRQRSDVRPSTAAEGPRLGNMPYCGRGRRRVTLPVVVHSTAPPEEWGAILHARSARSAPLAGVASAAAALGGVATRPGATRRDRSHERLGAPPPARLATPVDPCPLLE